MSTKEVGQAVERFQALKDKGATIGLLVTGPPDNKALFDLKVRILNVQDTVGDCLLAFAWQTDTFDSPPDRAFAHSDGTLVISLEGASLSLENAPEKLSISRGDFRCVLTVLRPTVFQQ